MSKIHPFITVLVLALLGLVGYAYESRAGDANPVRVVGMQKTLRDFWLGHIFMIQHVVLINVTNDLAGRGVADEKALANAKQIANTFTPFYGETRSEKLLSVLAGHSVAVKEILRSHSRGE